MFRIIRLFLKGRRQSCNISEQWELLNCTALDYVGIIDMQKFMAESACECIHAGIGAWFRIILRYGKLQPSCVSSNHYLPHKVCSVMRTWTIILKNWRLAPDKLEAFKLNVDDFDQTWMDEFIITQDENGKEPHLALGVIFGSVSRETSPWNACIQLFFVRNSTNKASNVVWGTELKKSAVVIGASVPCRFRLNRACCLVMTMRTIRIVLLLWANIIVDKNY